MMVGNYNLNAVLKNINNKKAIGNMFYHITNSFL